MSVSTDERRWETFADLTARMRERFESDLFDACEVVGVCVDEKIVAEAVDETFDAIRDCGLEVEDDGDPDGDYDRARDAEVGL
ncbi:hypothetical protein [Rhodococcoides fascians]|uniref:hypothetical protein n=1 Tax=Rhodococcoides fascians TaxID=1828 RepID=UPI000562159D|nr:hypothetical protein [Rhodococcus fascians]